MQNSNETVAELRECLKEAIDLMTLGEPTHDGIARWRKALEGAEKDGKGGWK